MKKIVSLLLALIVFAALLPSAVCVGAEESGLPFSDVKTGDWFYKSVKYAYDN